MNEIVNNHLKLLIERYPALEECRENILQAYKLLNECYKNGGEVLICGNGGSASDAEHIVGELMKGFLLKRKICKKDQEKINEYFPEDGKYLGKHLQGALPAISLISHTALASAYINDVAADMVYAQQVYGYGKAGDVLIGLSTSGNSKNVVNAVKIAKAFNIRTISLTGEKESALSKLCDVTITVPATETFKIQEYHLPIYHAICAMIESSFFEE